jgi:hypothetical protein
MVGLFRCVLNSWLKNQPDPPNFICLILTGKGGKWLAKIDAKTAISDNY